MKYTPIRGCSTFGAWLFSEWDMRHHWEGPYDLWRVHGFRILGFEFERVYRQKDG